MSVLRLGGAYLLALYLGLGALGVWFAAVGWGDSVPLYSAFAGSVEAGARRYYSIQWLERS